MGVLWKGMNLTWRQYAEETSVHGIKYAVGRRRLDRWIWFLLPVACGTVAGLLVALLSFRYLNSPTRTVYSTQFQPVGRMHFPAVTVCAPRKITNYAVQNFVAKLKLPEYVDRNRVIKAVPQLLGFVYPINVTLSELRLLDEVMQYNKIPPEEAMEMISPNCTDVLTRCRWEGKELPCQDLFRRSKTYLGYCCSFNYNVESKGVFKKLESEYIGPNMGLSFIIDTFIEEYSKQVYHKMDSFKILVHRSDSYASRYSDEVVLALRSEVLLGTVPQTLTTGSQAEQLTIEARKCLLPNELSLKYFSEYSKDNCILECEVRESNRKCGCHPFMYPRVASDPQICDAASIPCLIEHFMTVQTVGWDEPCPCPRQCNQNSSRLEIQATKLEAYSYNVDPFYNDITENQSLLHLYNDRQTATIVTRTINTYWVDLISSFGGMFNLFLGCSFLSVLEILYFLFVKLPRNYMNISAKERRRQMNQVAPINN